MKKAFIILIIVCSLFNIAKSDEDEDLDGFGYFNFYPKSLVYYDSSELDWSLEATLFSYELNTGNPFDLYFDFNLEYGKKFQKMAFGFNTALGAAMLPPPIINLSLRAAIWHGSEDYKDLEDGTFYLGPELKANAGIFIVNFYAKVAYLTPINSDSGNDDGFVAISLGVGVGF